MQGSLSLPQRLSLQSIVAVQSYRSFSLRSFDFHSFPRWQVLGLDEPAQNNLSSRSIQGTNRVLGCLASIGLTETTRMRGCSLATIFSCSYRTDVTPFTLNRVVAVPFKPSSSLHISSFGIPRLVQRSSAAQRLPLQSQRGYARKLDARVFLVKGEQDLLAKEEEPEFKRIVSEDDSITTFYSSDISSASEDEGMDRRAKTETKMKAAKVDADDFDSESDDNEENGNDRKKSKKLKASGNTEDFKRGNRGIERCDEESGSGSEDRKREQQLAELTMRKEERKYEGSDSESDDEEEKNLAKGAKAELKLKEKFDKENLKKMKKDEKQQVKEGKKLKATNKHKEEMDVDREANGDKKMKLNSKDKKISTAGRKDDMQSYSDNENGEEQDAKVKKTQTKLRVTEELASDSETEDEDDGVTDLAAEILEDDEEEFNIIEDETSANEIENELAAEMGDELEDLENDDDLWDEDEEGDVVAGDGGYGGGVVLGGTAWGKAALDLAEQVVSESGSDLSLFAFKVSPDGVIKVRLDKLSDRYGSPTMSDIERFSRKFTMALEEAGETGTLPKLIDVEVSSPGAERVVRVPDDLERFKDLPMYVQYLEGKIGPGKGHDQDLAEKDGVLELESLDMDAGLSVWKIANVKINREIKGKGRPLNTKQKKWRAEVPLAALKQVRLFVDV